VWKCSKCDEEIEDQFDECWNCSKDKLTKHDALLATAPEEIGAKDEIEVKDNNIIIYKFANGNVSIDPREHHVSNP
jgi:hypothetical protein